MALSLTTAQMNPCVCILRNCLNRNDVEFIYVSTIEEVLQNALLDEKVDGAIVVE